MAEYQRQYAELGAGPFVVTREVHADGTFSLTFGDGADAVVGHGNTRTEAAHRLAYQLRELARLVEALEGIN